MREFLARLRADLSELEEAIRWAHSDGYWSTNAEPVRRKVFGPDPLALAADPDPDEVPGEKYDLAVGSHRRRDALDFALVQLGVVERLWRQSHLIDKPRTFEWALRVIALNRLRVDAIERFDAVQSERTVKAVLRCTDRACRRLNAAFAEGVAEEPVDPDQPVVKVEKCKICDLRPQAPKDQKTGGRCKTCKTWFDRNGFERPKTQDQAEGLEAAKDAAKRRRSRGESFGDEGFAGVAQGRPVFDRDRDPYVPEIGMGRCPRCDQKVETRDGKVRAHNRPDGVRCRSVESAHG